MFRLFPEVSQGVCESVAVQGSQPVLTTGTAIYSSYQKGQDSFCYAINTVATKIRGPLFSLLAKFLEVEFLAPG